MAGEHTVDVVVPTRGRGALLAEALDSLRAQSVKPGRVVVVQDGAPADQRLRRAHSWCHWIENTRKPGAAGARNTGLEHVTARRVLFLDDDDQVDPFFTERTLAVLAETQGREPVGIATGFRIKSSAGVREISLPTETVGLDDLLAQNVVGPTSFVLCSAEAVRAVGGFDEALPAAQDWDLWLRLAGQGELLRISEVLGTYRVHDLGQISSQTPAGRYRKYRRFFEKRREHPGFPRVRDRVANEMYWWGVLMAWCGDLEDAEEAFRTALSHAPLHWKARLMLAVLKTPVRRLTLRLVYLGREGSMWLEDRREPLPLR